MGLREWLRHRARAKGFGVHSPFAFRFVTEVLNEPCAYYAYSRLPRRLDMADEALIFRVINYFAPRSVWAAGEGLAEIARLVSADTTLAATPGEADMVLVSQQLTDHESVAVVDAVVAGANIVIVRGADPGLEILWREILAKAPHGMSFADTKAQPAVFASLRHLPRQDFSLSLRHHF